MINIELLQTNLTKLNPKKNTLSLVFESQHFVINKDTETFHFIPIEGKQIIIDLNSLQVQNLGEVFVFQRGNRFIRLPLYQLLLISNLHDFLIPLIENILNDTNEIEQEVDDSTEINESELRLVIEQLEQVHVLQLIDRALDTRDEPLFIELTRQLKV